MENKQNGPKKSDSGTFKKIRNARKLEDVQKYLEADNLASIIEIIRNESLGPLVYERFSNDRRSSVRLEVATQRNVTPELLEILQRDSNHLVRTTAKAAILEIEKKAPVT